MSEALIWLWTWSVATFSPAPLIGQCDPVDGPRLEWTDDDRREVRRRVKEAARELGYSPIMVAYIDASAERESRYRSSVRHTYGKNEDGLGVLGLGKHHAGKWPGAWEDMCTPEASVLVVSDILHRAYAKHGARTPWGMQAVFAGRFGCTPNGKRECTPAQQDRTTAAICGRMEARGFSCYQPITAKDMGRRVPMRDREGAAREMIER